MSMGFRSSAICMLMLYIGWIVNSSKVKSLPKPDLILSSGFLAFARQVGVLEAVEDCGIGIHRIVGTSSGALAGAMMAAGYTSQDIGRELSCRKPIDYLRPPSPRRIRSGLFSLDGLITHLSSILPKDFKDLKHPLGVSSTNFIVIIIIIIITPFMVVLYCSSWSV